MSKGFVVARVSGQVAWLLGGVILGGCGTTAPTASDPVSQTPPAQADMDSLCRSARSLDATDGEGIGAGAANLRSCLERMAGAWEMDPNETTDLEKALDSAVATYPASVKDQVRSRLQAVAKVPGRLDLRVAWPTVAMGTDGGSGISRRPDAVAAPFEEGGEEIWLATRWEGNRLIQSFQASDGIREDAYGLSADARKLVLVSSTNGDGMSRPLVVTTTYRRK